MMNKLPQPVTIQSTVSTKRARPTEEDKRGEYMAEMNRIMASLKIENSALRKEVACLTKKIKVHGLASD